MTKPKTLEQLRADKERAAGCMSWTRTATVSETRTASSSSQKIAKL